MAQISKQLPRFTMLQLLLAATLVAVLLGLAVSAADLSRTDAINHLCYSPNGEYLAAHYERSGMLRVWRLPSNGAPIQAWTSHSARRALSTRESIFFLDNLRLLRVVTPYTSGSVGQVQEIDVVTGRIRFAKPVTTPWAGQEYAAASGNKLYLADPQTNVVRLYLLPECEVVRDFTVGTQPVRSVTAALNGNTVVVTDAAGTVHILDANDADELRTLPNSRWWSACLSPEGNFLATVEVQPLPEFRLTILNIAGDKLDSLDTNLHNIPWLAISNNGRSLVAAGDLGILNRYELETKKLSGQTFSAVDAGLAPANYEHAISPDGLTAATSGNGDIIFREFSCGTVLARIDAHSWLLPATMFLCGLSVWAGIWGIVQKRDRESLVKRDVQSTESDGCKSTATAPLVIKICWGLMIVGGLVALGIPIVLMFKLGPLLFPTVYFSLFVGLSAIARGAARDTANLRRTAGLQLANMIALDPANVVFAAMEFALLRTRSVREYLGAENR